MPVSLKDQVVLILGASSGIGRETAVLFAREGARVLGGGFIARTERAPETEAMLKKLEAAAIAV